MRVFGPDEDVFAVVPEAGGVARHGDIVLRNRVVGVFAPVH